MKAFIEALFEKIHHDPEVRDFFKNVDLSNEIQGQLTFFTSLFGEPPSFSGKSLFNLN